MPFQPPQQQQQPQQYQPQQQQIYQPVQPQQQQFNNNHSSYMAGAPQQTLQTAAAARQPTPEPPRAKQPLPEEYVYMQTVFNELRQQCSTTPAANAQIKRKLEDVSKRLESLYDLLRDDRVSRNRNRYLWKHPLTNSMCSFRCSSPPTR